MNSEKHDPDRAKNRRHTRAIPLNPLDTRTVSQHQLDAERPNTARARERKRLLVCVGLVDSANLVFGVCG